MIDIFMKEKSLKKALACRKIKKPNPVLALIVHAILFCINLSHRVKFTYDYDKKAMKKEPVILLAGHASYPEYLYVTVGLGRRDINIVCGYHNFLQKFVYTILKKLGVIAKYLYQPDLTSAKQMLSVARRKGSLLLFPEGIQSSSGSHHPINPATAQMLKACKLTVLMCLSEGAYLSRNRYSSDVKRGKITLHYSVLFTKEQIATLSVAEIDAIMREKFKYNEFEANRRNRVAYVGKYPNITGLDKLIYTCPMCHSESTMKVAGESMTCASCGFGVKMNAYYDLLPLEEHGPLPFSDIDEWYKWQRRVMHKAVQSPDFSMTMQAELYTVSDTKLLFKGYSRILQCRGTLKMTRAGLSFTDAEGKVLASFESKNVYSLTFIRKGFLEFYYHNEFYIIQPISTDEPLTKWTIASEELHNLDDPEWQRVSNEVYHYDLES